MRYIVIDETGWVNVLTGKTVEDIQEDFDHEYSQNGAPLAILVPEENAKIIARSLVGVFRKKRRKLNMAGYPMSARLDV